MDIKNLNLGISKQGMEWVLYREDFAGQFDYSFNRDKHIALEVHSDDGNGILNIYFKTNGLVSFLAQGQNPDAATDFARRLVSYIKSKQ